MSITRVQSAASGVNTSSVTVTLGATPAAGDLLVAWANSDALVTIGGSGWNAGPVVIDGNGAYGWWKVAGAGEPAAVTFTPSVPDWIVAGLLEYGGTDPAPFDASGSSTISGTPSTSTTAVTVTTAAGHELGVALAHLHAGAGAAEPTAPSWSAGFTVAQAHGMDVGGTTAVYTITGDNLDLGTAGSVTTAASWTGAYPDAQEILMTFKAGAAPAGGQWVPQLVTPNQGFF